MLTQAVGSSGFILVSLEKRWRGLVGVSELLLAQKCDRQTMAMKQDLIMQTVLFLLINLQCVYYQQ